MPSIAIPGSEAILVFEPEDPADPHAFRWRIRRGDQARGLRIRLGQVGEWVLTPQPANEAERRRAAAQLAMPLLQTPLAAADFFAPGQANLEVTIDSFHPHMTEQGQLPWNPVATPYLP